ncbi:hypothetical protein [Allopontixanthobacter sp.]|uniref:hypothetical protein n=1 Tax=Allopontixanthobacter sp. TaxID=2906452 RepID=UPI002ABB2E45|nr:hypothetical protein [Allopontixanthobacter sp.]MDZ4306732.1 hypothetical protein [Allopontixanthobacter sp.]
MADPQRKTNLLWILVIALLGVLVVIWFLSPATDDDFIEPEATEMLAPEPMMTTAPEGGVPVQLPDAPMTNVPEEQPTPAPVETPQ